MKIFRLLFTLLPLLGHAAEPTLKDLLQQGLMAEEADGDLARAAKAYESLVTAGDAQQKLVATGLYRLAEVRRKQDKKDEAARLYQRLITEFPGQETLVKMARENLVAMGATLPVPSTPALPPADDPESQEIARMEKLLIESPDRARDERPLHEAAEKGWKRLLEAMMAKGFDVNQPGENFMGNDVSRPLLTPLTIAAGAGNKAIAELLIAHGADVNGGHPKAGKNEDSQGLVPLTRAISGQRLEMLQLLLDHGASQALHTWLSYGVEGAPLHLAVMCGKQPGGLEVLQMLLKHDPDLEAVTTGRGIELQPSSPRIPPGTTALGLAAMRGDRPLAEALIAAGAKVDATDDLGRTPLFEAPSSSNDKPPQDLVTLLIDHGASLAVRDKQGCTPLAHLFVPVERNHQDPSNQLPMKLPKAKLLLARGADPKVTDNDGNTLLHLGAMDHNFGFQPSLLATTAGADEVDAWLISLGIDPSLKNKKGETALDITLRNSRMYSHLSLSLSALTVLKDHGVWSYSPPSGRDSMLTSLYAPMNETEPLPSVAEFALLQLAYDSHRASQSGQAGNAVRPSPSKSARAMMQVIHHATPDIPVAKLLEDFDLNNGGPILDKPLRPGDALFINNPEGMPVEDSLLARLDLGISVSYSGVERRFHLGGNNIWDVKNPELPWGLWPEILRPLVDAIDPVDLTKVRLVRQVNGKPVALELNLLSGIASGWPRVMNGDHLELAASGPPPDAAVRVTISLPDLGLAFAAPNSTSSPWDNLSSTLRSLPADQVTGRDWSHLKVWHQKQSEPVIFDLAKAAAAMGPNSDPDAFRGVEPRMKQGDRVEIPLLPGHEAEPMDSSVQAYITRLGERVLIRPGVNPSAPTGGRRRVMIPPNG